VAACAATKTHGFAVRGFKRSAFTLAPDAVTKNAEPFFAPAPEDALRASTFADVDTAAGPDPGETPESAHCGRRRGKRRATFAQDWR